TLLTAVAAALTSQAIIPSVAIGTVTAKDLTTSPILKQLSELDEKDKKASEMLAPLKPDNPAAKDKKLVASIQAVRKHYSDFFIRVTTADAQGVVPITRAARLEQLTAAADRVLRVHVEKAGGSLINKKNIATFFGADPVHVTGGLVVSYTLTNPS